jgi:hypothetical protein
MHYVAQLIATPTPTRTLMSCTTTTSGGREGGSVTTSSQRNAVVRSTGNELIYEVSAVGSGQVRSRELEEIPGTAPEPRATIVEDDNGLTTWSYATGGFNATTGEIVFGTRESIVFDRRTGSVQFYDFGNGPALTGLATLTTVNCVAAQ